MRSETLSALEREQSASVLTRGLLRYWPAAGVNSPVFQARFPDLKRLLRMAREAAKGRIRYWHPWHMEKTHESYRLGPDIDWVTSPNGDHEWIESLVRFNHMIDLAAAYCVTSDKEFAEAFSRYLSSFHLSRSKPARHWKFKLNLAIRIINLVRAYDLLARSDVLDRSVHLLVLENILTDVQNLLVELDSIKGNGAFFIATALLIAALYLEHLFDVESWRCTVERRLSELLRTEIQADGVEIEQVPMYHGQVLLTLLDYGVALRSNQRPIDEPLKSAMISMFAVLDGLADPQGKIPPIGDSDRFDVGYISRFYGEILEESDKKAIDHIGTESPVVDRSSLFSLKCFSDTGWSVARWKHTDGQLGYLLFDCSGKPSPGYGGHSHADDLQFLLHGSKGPIFTDPGRFTYCREFKAYFPFSRRRIDPHSAFRGLYKIAFPEFMALAERDWKKFFQRTLSHNTISCNGNDQIGYGSREEIGPRARLIRQATCGRLLLLEGDLGNTNELGLNAENLPYQHNRVLIGLHSCTWLVIDRVRGSAPRRWINSFHLDSAYQVYRDDWRLRLVGNGENHLFASLPTSSQIDHEISIDDDWMSPVYNLKRRSKTIRLSSQSCSAAVFVAVIQLKTASQHYISRVDRLSPIQRTNDSAADAYSVCIVEGSTVTRIVVNLANAETVVDGLGSDAKAFYECRSGGQLIEAGFIDGTHLTSGDLSLTAGSGGKAHFSSLSA